MPSYYYHLKLELYPTPNPTAPSSECGGKDDGVWIPSRDSSIFEDLPAHPRRRGTTPPQLRISLPQYAEDPFLPERHATAQAVHQAPGVIDCGATRPRRQNSSGNSNFAILSERQWRERSESLPTPGFAAGIGPRTARRDWRFGPLSIESFDLEKWGGNKEEEEEEEEEGPAGSMEEETHHPPTPAASLGPNLGGPGQATKGRYIPLETKNTEIGWGIVHLYRESDESYTFGGPSSRKVEGPGGEDGDNAGEGGAAAAEDGCTILCIPSVPSYLSPSDFLGFVGEKWRGDVSHYRMVMTSRMNQYMVLMKFRDSFRASQWRKEFDGKVFNSMEAEICHVTFIKSITVEAPTVNNSGTSESKADRYGSSSAAVAKSLKPFPPPTPNLIELPTCTVCLERMDDTSGLMTILCQHVFHCTCLQTWKGTGCPVCRATNPSLMATEPGSHQGAYDPNDPYKRPFGTGVSNLCTVCDCTSDLWICLICGYVGCGRYKGGHAKDHWKQTAHSYSLELETQHVWDYAGDMWVHRLLRDKGDGKVVELPRNNSSSRRPGSRNGPDDGSNTGDEDVVPRAKLDNIGLEYTHLLTSQLESQRIYFEEMVNKAADKAAKAAAAAETASAQARDAMGQLLVLKAEHKELKEEVIPSLERDLARECTKATKSTDLARSLGKSLQEEKKVSEGLMERIGHVNKELEAMKKTMGELRVENEELKDTNRDLTMFISGQEKLKEMEEEGRIEQAELEDGKVSLPEDKKSKNGGKGKGKAKR